MKRRYVVIDLPINSNEDVGKLEDQINAYANRGFKVESFRPYHSSGGEFSRPYAAVLMSVEIP
jgi:hypothetical protein